MKNNLADIKTSIKLVQTNGFANKSSVAAMNNLV